MTCKIPNFTSAVGYWGRDIYKRIESEQIPAKIQALLWDKLRSRGKNIYLWREVLSTTPGVLPCSCIKDTSSRADITCSSCYGTQLIPGYLRFLHTTYFAASISENLVLTNTILDTQIKPYRILLQDCALTGTITFPAIPYSNLLNLNWDYKIDAPNILETNTVEVTFSTNNITFYPIAEINDLNKKPLNAGNLYFKVTLTRANADDRSPEFEILRVRHPNKIDPYILILRPQFNEVSVLMQYGRRLENLGERFWTVPLSFFDSQIVDNTPECKILENAFYERVSGINAGSRFVVAKNLYNEEFGRFTHQSFEPRRVQSEEVYSALVF